MTILMEIRTFLYKHKITSRRHYIISNDRLGPREQKKLYSGEEN